MANKAMAFAVLAASAPYEDFGEDPVGLVLRAVNQFLIRGLQHVQHPGCCQVQNLQLGEKQARLTPAPCPQALATGIISGAPYFYHVRLKRDVHPIPGYAAASYSLDPLAEA